MAAPAVLAPGFMATLGKFGSMMGGASSAPGAGSSVTGKAQGIMQMIQAARAKTKADSAMPGLIDPDQAAFLAELGQKKKAIDTGADFSAGMSAVDQTTAQTDDAIIKSTGGDVGGTIQGLLQSEKVAGKNKNDVFAKGQESQKYYTGAYGDLLNKISARKMQLQLYKSQQNCAEWAQLKQDGMANLLGGQAKTPAAAPPVIPPTTIADPATAASSIPATVGTPPPAMATPPIIPQDSSNALQLINSITNFGK